MNTYKDSLYNNVEESIREVTRDTLDNTIYFDGQSYSADEYEEYDEQDEYGFDDDSFYNYNYDEDDYTYDDIDEIGRFEF